MNNNTPDIDFSTLEHSSAFRADYLYFLRLVNNYIGEIFCQSYPKGTNNKNAKKRSKKLNQIVDELEENSVSNHRYIIEFIRNRNGTLDCFSESFCKILGEIKNDNSLAESLINKLQEEHAIFYQFEAQKELLDITDKDGKLPIKQMGKKTDFKIKTNHKVIRQAIDDLIADIDYLRQKRNYLEHFERDKNKPKKNIDNEVITILGNFLLPDLSFLFAGRMKHYAKRLDEHIVKRMEGIIEQCEDIFREENENRRKRTNIMFDFVLSKKNQKMRDNRTKRQALVNGNLKWRQEYRKTSQQKGDYKANQFRMRYAFIGQKNIDIIKKELEKFCSKKDRQNLNEYNIKSDGYKVDFSFKREIEPIYYLSQKINLVLHRVLSLCLDEKYEKTLEERILRRFIGGSKAQKKYRREIRECRNTKSSKRAKKIRQIRDPLAHNGIFWHIEKKGIIIPVFDIFRQMDEIISQATFIETTKGSDLKRKELRNNMKVQILRLLEKDKYSLQTKIDEPAISKIKKWKPQYRENKKKTSYKFHMRRPVLRLIGNWRKKLNESFEK